MDAPEAEPPEAEAAAAAAPTPPAVGAASPPAVATPPGPSAPPPSSAKLLRAPTRVCALCPSERGPPPASLPANVSPKLLRAGVRCPPLGGFVGPFLPDRDGFASAYAHETCVVWCPEVYFDPRRERLKHVDAAIKRGKQLKCTHCGLRGAAIGCTVARCPRSYHLRCAHAVGSRFHADSFQVACPVHKSHKRTPAPAWSKTMNGDERLREQTDANACGGSKRPEATNDGEARARSEANDPMSAAADAAAAEETTYAASRRSGPTGATPLLERLAKTAGPAPNAVGGGPSRRSGKHARTVGFDAALEDLRNGVVRPAKMGKVDRTRAVIASVMSAAERVRREEEGEMDDEEAFAARERRRLTKDKAKIACVTVGGSFGTGGFFEGEEEDPEDPEDPEDHPEEKEDPSGAPPSGAPPSRRGPLGFGRLAGMRREVDALKELVSLPLTYPEAFSALGVPPGRGVLIHGPPGTGKTLAVKALIAHLARGPRPVTFFHRKGADCLGKYSGEAERNVRLLFSEAERRQPSVVFFDEIDGLAPARRMGGPSGGGDGSDQIHASVVSTMLAVMDGLNPRGSVVVIGATNRPDAVDPALRRPGRFDRELYFGLPGPEARAAILRVHTRGWRPRPTERTIAAIASRTEGAAGADLRALAAAALTRAIRRVAGREVLAGDATRDELAARLEAALPLPASHRAARAEARRLAAESSHAGAALALEGAEALGARVEIFWSGDGAFYPGCVSGYDAATLTHRITYDDGEAHWIRLWSEGEVVRRIPTDSEGGGLLSSPRRPLSPDDALRNDAPPGAAAGASEGRSLSLGFGASVARAAAALEPGEVLASCKNKLGAFDPRATTIRCLCAACAASAPGGAADAAALAAAGSRPKTLWEPRRWEAHCGMGHAKKWKQTVRIALEADDGVAAFDDSNSTPVGRWLAAKMAGMDPGAVDATRSRRESTLAPPPLAPPLTPGGDSAAPLAAPLAAPFSASRCAAEALRLRETYRRSAALFASAGGLRVTAADWASALKRGSAWCATRTARGAALSVVGAPLPRRLAPALARPLARLVDEMRAANVIGSDGKKGDDAARGTTSDARGDPEAFLDALGLVDGARAGVRTTFERDSTECRRDERDDDEDDEDDAWGADEEGADEEGADEEGRPRRSNADSEARPRRSNSTALDRLTAESAAYLSGRGASRSRPSPFRALVCGAEGCGIGGPHFDASGRGLVVKALARALQGIPSKTISLATLFAEGEGDPARGVAAALREPLRVAARNPSLVVLADLETWALEGVELEEEGTEEEKAEEEGTEARGDAASGSLRDAAAPSLVASAGVAPSRLWDVFEQTCDAAPSADAADGAATGSGGCLIVVASAGVAPDQLPPRVLEFFGGGGGGGGGVRTREGEDVHGGGAKGGASRSPREIIAVLDPPDASTRAAVFARGAAATFRDAVVPAAAAFAARETSRREKKNSFTRAPPPPTPEPERSTRTFSSSASLRRLRTVASARRSACVALALRASRARDAVGRAVARASLAVARSFGAHSRRRLRASARSVLSAAAAGEFRDPAAFLAAVRRSCRGTRSRNGAPTRARPYPGGLRAAADAHFVDRAEAAARDAGAFDADATAREAEAEAEAEDGEARRAEAEAEEAERKEKEAFVEAERKEKEVFVEAERKEKESAPAGAVGSGPSLFDPAKLRAGPSVEEAARASAALASALVRGVEDALRGGTRRSDEGSNTASDAVGRCPTRKDPPTGALERVVATAAAELTRRARRGDAHLAGDAGSLVAMVRGASEVIRRACESAVREASGRE